MNIHDTNKEGISKSDSDLGWDNAEGVYKSWSFRLIVFCILLIQLFFVSNYMYKVFFYESVTGELTHYLAETKVIGAQEEIMYAPVYEYVYNDRVYHSTSSVFRGSPQAEIGDRVDFFIDGNNPENVQIKSVTNLMSVLLVALLAGIGLLFLFVLSSRLIMIRILKHSLQELFTDLKK